MTATTIEREEIQIGSSSSSTIAQPTRTIAISVDGSKYSEHAVTYAINNVINPSSDAIILLHVRPTFVIPPAPDVNYNTYHEKVEKKYQQDSHDILQKYLDIIHASGVEYTHGVKAHGLFGEHAKETIVDFVNRHLKNADTLVIGSRGLNAVSRALLGSTSDYVAHHAHCSVLIVKPTSEESKKEKLVETVGVNEAGFTAAPVAATYKAI
ncbi:UNVERIFIED_CONTAM: hypothetical protein HDU68_007823 [Siphonaria sp. JEL0065]|nr:hypothetical protein HDU68_007823 [Siphonaria sp. JEL0065]